MKRKVIFPLFIGLGILIDQLVKQAIVAYIPLGEVKSFISGVLSLTYLQNRGAAYSILENQQWFFFIVTAIVLAGATWYMYKHIKGSLWTLSALSLIIAGGLGNFIDRVSQGFVVDMFQLEFIQFAIFNVADIYLTIGVLLMLLVMVKEEKNGN